jgi:hypothetical protein
MILIEENFFDLQACDYLKNLAIANKEKAKPFRDIHTLELPDLDNVISKKIGAFLINFLSKKNIDAFPELMQITLWQKNSTQGMHLDEERSTTNLTSILYLNDDYEGGETYFENGVIIKPKKGKIVFFDGKKYPHGVHPLKNNNRYVLAVWYTDNLNFINM